MSPQQPRIGASGVKRLSPREYEVLELASLGLTNLELASRLGLSVHAIKFHLAAIYRKLGVANRTQAVAVHLRSTVTSMPETGIASASTGDSH